MTEEKQPSLFGEPTMWVTLYCDASFANGQGSWGIWLRSALGRVVEHGKCPDWVQDNNVAEMYAAFMGITKAKEVWPETFGVLVNSDCMTVVDGIYPWSKPNKHDDIRLVQDNIRSFIESRKMRIRTKHVKGHTGGGDIRSWLNRQVDINSRKART